MSAVAVVLIVVAIVGLVVVAMAVQSLILTLRSLRETVEDLRRETLPAIAELRATVDSANGELARVDALLDTAEEVGARVEATSRLTWLVLRNPLVKLASASVASDRVARKLSRVDDDEVVAPLALDSGLDDRGRRSGSSRRRGRSAAGRRARRAG
ncbi:MAG TPA: hypothetical protein VIY72_16915 [Acidimicrobiales bacterium]